jgi:hypothetical protein
MDNYLEDIKDVVLIITPIATLFITVRTINKWKTEFQAKAYFDCSYRFLKTVYSLRDTFSGMRANFIVPSEFLPKTDSKNYNRENECFILENRSIPFKEALNNFYSIMPEVETLFTKETRKICGEINVVVFQYNMYVNEYLQLIDNTNNFEHLGTVRKNIFSDPNDDKLKTDLDAAISKIENAVSKYLKLNN